MEWSGVSSEWPRADGLKFTFGFRTVREAGGDMILSLARFSLSLCHRVKTRPVFTSPMPLTLQQLASRHGFQSWTFGCWGPQ
jgi:hypothetical protein